MICTPKKGVRNKQLHTASIFYVIKKCSKIETSTPDQCKQLKLDLQNK